MSDERVIVVGAGIGGLTAALDMVARGCQVTLLERAAYPGGKMREVSIGDHAIDAGPTVFTMRWVFDGLFDTLGTQLEAELELEQVDVLARHAWSETERLDLFCDVQRSADEIGEFSGSAEAKRFLRFSEHARKVYETLELSFICAPKPGPIDLVRSGGLSGLTDLWQIKPFNRLWKTLGGYFKDSRLQQLFGRYSTYCGSSPFQSPATLMLVAHVEQEGVWLIKGGMARLAWKLASLAEARGVDIRYQSEVSEINCSAGKVNAVTLSNGERLHADAVVLNADPAALGAGLLGKAVTTAAPTVSRQARSLSAVTWNLATQTSGFPLLRHNVFFSDDYVSEFEEIFGQRRLPRKPTVYVCAQDRGGVDGDPIAGAERLLCLVNAPADGDLQDFTADELAACESAAFQLLSNCGLKLQHSAEMTRVTTPAAFNELFPGTGGALYGQASHGWQASFSRPGARSRVPGLYLAGGSVHPGPGVPMAALSGRIAAASLIEDYSRKTRVRGVGQLSRPDPAQLRYRPRSHPEPE